ncbi:MAG: hypothetical protein IKC12_02985 [Alistipes sp.]|nr:hypothetical protein [Alistipes sp.]
MRRVSFIIVAAAMFMAMGCEEVIVGPITDEPYISFHEDWMTLPAEGGEILVPLTSTGVDNVFIGNDSTWVEDENGDLLPIDEWMEIVKVINEYDAEAGSTRALAKWDSAIVIRVQPNDTNYGRSATLSAQSFSASDRIIVCQPSVAE